MEKSERQEILQNIYKAVVASKPRIKKGKATYLGQTYTSLDDAWDWFENDLDFLRYDIAEHFLGHSLPDVA
jgi:hypothetical protein